MIFFIETELLRIDAITLSMGLKIFNVKDELDPISLMFKNCLLLIKNFY